MPPEGGLVKVRTRAGQHAERDVSAPGGVPGINLDNGWLERSAHRGLRVAAGYDLKLDRWFNLACGPAARDVAGVRTGRTELRIVVSSVGVSWRAPLRSYPVSASSLSCSR